MDPNATLDMLRAEIQRSRQSDADRLVTELESLHVAELFESLDEWLSRGGFLPTAWERVK